MALIGTSAVKDPWSYNFKETRWSFRSKKAEIPIYSFAKHQREKETTTIYSPHVLILEGIFALYDTRVIELLDMKVLIVLAGFKCNTLNCSRYFAKKMQTPAWLDEVRNDSSPSFHPRPSTFASRRFMAVPNLLNPILGANLVTHYKSHRTNTLKSCETLQREVEISKDVLSNGSHLWSPTSKNTLNRNERSQTSLFHEELKTMSP